MQIRLQCSCGQRYKIAPEHAGKYFACKSCRKSLYVPAPPPAPPPVCSMPVLPVVGAVPVIQAELHPGPPPLPTAVTGSYNAKTRKTDLVLLSIGGALVVGSVFGLIALLVTVQVPSKDSPKQTVLVEPAPSVSIEVTKQAMATKAAWNRIRQISIESAIFDSSNRLEFYRRLFLAHAQIQLDDVDRELAAWELALLGTLREMCDILAAYEAEQSRLQANINTARDFGGQIGSTYQSNPQGGAVVGQLFFGIMVAADAEARLATMREQSEKQFSELQVKAVEQYQQLLVLQETLQYRYQFELLDIR